MNTRLNLGTRTDKKDDDIIISASPEFLLKPICERLGIKKYGFKG